MTVKQERLYKTRLNLSKYSFPFCLVIILAITCTLTSILIVYYFISHPFELGLTTVNIMALAILLIIGISSWNYIVHPPHIMLY